MNSRIIALSRYIIPRAIIQQRVSCTNCILFTFDDGPHPEITPRILDLCDAHSCRCIFFIPATRIERAPALMAQILDRGHTIGNHSFSHSSPVGMSFDQCRFEISECQRGIESETGFRPIFYRSPKGMITFNLLRAIRVCKVRFVRWSIDSGEYSHSRYSSPEEMGKSLLQRIHDRAIVLSHDDCDRTPGMLEYVLPRLNDKGYNLACDLNVL